MNSYGLTFHHLGLAAKEPAAAAAFVRTLGYEIGPAVTDTLQNVNLMFCKHPSMPAVEIITPGNPGEPGPLTTYLQAASGVIYHLCFECADLQDALAALKADNHRVTCISEPKPAVLFGGKSVSFYRVRGVGTIEILEGKPS